jgi:hypothetical protein
MPTPTTSDNFNAITPSAPSGQQNVKFQSDSGTPQQKISAYMPLATSALAGAVYPDGATCEVDGAGKLTVLGTTGTTDASEIQGIAVSATTPTTGDTLVYNGTEWAPGVGGVSVMFGSANPNGANTPSIVQSVNTALSATATLGSAVAAGNLLLVIAAANNGLSTATISDSLGTTFTQLVYEALVGMSIYVWAGTLTASGTDTITISGSGDAHMISSALELSGCTSSLDVAVQSVSSSASPSTDLTVTTSVPNDLLIGVYADSTGDNSGSMSAGWTNLFFNQDGDYWDMAVGYQVASTVGSYSGNWTNTKNHSSNTVMIALKATADPVSGTDGDLYFQTGSSPYTSYVLHSGTWQLFS